MSKTREEIDKLFHEPAGDLVYCRAGRRSKYSYKGTSNMSEEELQELLQLMKEERPSEEVRSTYQEMKDADVLDDRREYDLEDVEQAYPDMTAEDCKRLYEMFQS